MVLKSSKNGVYSGNTLRASNSRYNRLYRSHGCIVRRYVRNAEKRVTRMKTLIDNFDITAYDVEFSLNKKERWGLPDAIKNNIIDDENLEESHKTDLVVRHKLKRQANCVAYYANKGLLKRLVPREGRYFDGKSATNFKTKPKKEKRRRQPEDGEQTTEEVIPEDTIRYEVFVPCSRFSSLVHNPKYIKPEYAEEESTHFGGGRKKKKRTRLTSRDIDEILEYSDPRNDDIRELEMASEDSDVTNDDNRGKFTLRDFLKPERKMKRKSQRRLSRESDNTECKKSRIVYVEEKSEKKDTVVGLESPGSETVTSSYLKPPTIVYSVAVKLNQNETAFDSLQTTYGVRYLEARCEPRKFSIDITGKVREHVKSSKHFRDVTSSSLELLCYLSFTEVSKCDGNLFVYNVGLNISSHMNSIKLENILEMETYSIPELEAKVMCYIDMLPREVFVRIDISNKLCEPIMKFSLLNKAMKWQVKCIHPSDHTDNIVYQTELKEETVNCEFPSQYCNICFDEIRTDGESGTCTDAPATCLDACGHWFCDRCWRDHLISNLRTGARNFRCPEYECNADVDFATLLSFLHIGDIQKHATRQESEKINTSSQAMWCPMPHCGRAIWANKANERPEAPRGVVCKCGTDLCFKCLKNAHWPATCQQARWFREKLIILKDFMDLPKTMFIDNLPDAIMVNGKSCPKCRRFIEKISGCPNMSCPCGATFCWTCVQLIKPYSAHDCITKGPVEMVIGPDDHISKGTYDFGLRRTRFYTTALDHRKMRLYPNFCRFRARAFAIARRLAAVATKDKTVLMQISKLQQSDDRSLHSKICKFVMRIVSVKLELHHVIEHLAVAMDNMPNGNRRTKFQNVLSNMEYYVHTIGTLLERGARQDLRFILPSLREIEMNAQRSVSNLSHLVSSVADV